MAASARPSAPRELANATAKTRRCCLVWLQGGTHWTHWAYVLESAVAAMRAADAAAEQ